MKFSKLILLALVIVGIGFNSCKKEAGVTVTSEAIIRNSGPLQGCGYTIVIQINNSTYSPKNLTSEFQPTDSVKVRVTYELLNTTRACTVIAGSYQEVNIKSIQKIQ